ncbi:hypothetical protein FNH09_43560 [Streptomyces adustus]|uniref:Uncharacterized protein n=1 Tax=Streptomyces adustus TaxID=1609272 RepID=A0A5N8VUX8_9ACTN|nr:hypothetical protein [Streptomyces adustus]MPY37848.1 hypothetical protein [Streptomyces adustus]
MVISISAALLLGIVVVLLLRSGYVRFGSALACVLFGFALASTGLAPAVTAVLEAVTGWLAALPL